MTESYWISYPAKYKKHIKPLLHQQMWLFGRDILCPEGNLLCEYSFTRERSAGRGGSMYTRRDGAQQIVLWGWGIWFGQVDTGAIFVNRYKARPQFTAVSVLSQTVHREEALPQRTDRVSSVTEAQTMQRLWVNLLDWLADYEAWVLATAGDCWRQSTLQSFNQAVTKPEAVDQLAKQWQTLAEQSHAFPINSNTKKEGIR